jgi:membrane associated rhomboid family serine protease
MAINGAGIFDADGYTQVTWGSNFTPLTLSGDWWRLITCMFIHFGIIHLAMNTYALYMAGIYLEPMLGKTRFIVAYLCTGIVASIASLWWHSEGVNSAGASGAIFGMYGVFLALLFTNLIPKQIRGALLQSIGVFVVFNLIFGMKAGVDNAAHVGGLVSGVIIGFVYYPLLKKNETGIKSRVALAAIAGITVLSAWMYLNSPRNIVSPEKRQAELDFLKETRFTDGEEFLKKYNEFAETDGRIVRLFNDNSQTYAEWIGKNEQKVNEEFKKAEAIINAMKSYKVSEKAKKRVNLLEQLLNARREEVSIIKKLSIEDNDTGQQKRLEIQKKEEDIVNELKKG